MISLNSHSANLFHLGNFDIRCGLPNSSLLVGEGLLNPSFLAERRLSIVRGKMSDIFLFKTAVIGQF